MTTPNTHALSADTAPLQAYVQQAEGVSQQLQALRQQMSNTVHAMMSGLKGSLPGALQNAWTHWDAAIQSLTNSHDDLHQTTRVSAALYQTVQSDATHSISSMVNS